MLKDSSKTEVALDQKSPKNLGHPLWAVAVTILIYLVIQIVLTIISIILMAIHHDAKYSLDKSIAAQFVAILIAEGLAVYLILNILKRRHLHRSIIGLGRRPVLSDVWKAAVGYIAFFVLFAAISLLINRFSPGLTNQKQDVGFTDLTTHADNVLAFVALVLLPPIGEEILFRGYLYSALRGAWSFLPSLLMTSLLFGSFHLLTGASGLLWIAAVETFFLSIVLVYLREKTGALYAGMLVHMLNNLLAFLVVIK